MKERMKSAPPRPASWIVLPGLLIVLGVTLAFVFPPFSRKTVSSHSPAEPPPTDAPDPSNLPALGVSDWPVFRGTPDSRGRVEAAIPNRPEVLWKFKTGDAVLSTAAIVAGRVYVGSDDGTLYCLAAATGEKLWSFSTDGSFEASPLVAGGVVYVGETDGWFYALDAQSGRKLWSCETGGAIHGAANAVFDPTGQAARILVGSYDYNLYGFDAHTGRRLWTCETDNYVNGAVSIADDQAVLGSCDGILRFVRHADGRTLREKNLECFIPGTIALADGQVFLACTGGESDNRGRLLCMDQKTRRRRWTYSATAEKGFFSSPAVGEALVFIGGRDRMLHAVRRTDGAGVWRFPAGDAVDSSPVLCAPPDGKGPAKVLFGSDDGRLYCLAADTGETLWSYRIGPRIVASPAVAEGRIVIGCEDGTIFAFQNVREVGQ
jgi:outer membrane protein assembly factor BamB